MTNSFSSPIEVLRTAANGKTFDEERTRSEIKSVVRCYCAAAICTSIHKDQVRSRDAEKVLESVVGHLNKLRERLDTMTEETWRDWPWIAADVYNELPDVHQELKRRNATLADEFAETDVDLCDYVVTEVDQVGRDLRDLRRIVAKVEPRLRAVFESMTATMGKDGRPTLVARRDLFRNLKTIYERDTGEKATAIKDESELGAHSRFIDFVLAVNKEMRPSLPLNELGTTVKNFLYSRKSRS